MPPNVKVLLKLVWKSKVKSPIQGGLLLECGECIKKGFAMRFHRLGWLSVFRFIVSLAIITASPSSFAMDKVTVAAAATLRFALADIAKQYQDQTGQQIDLVFGSSGNFYNQISQGAPFDLFMSADEDYVLKLQKAGKVNNAGVVYARGQLAFLVPKGGAVKADSQFDDLRKALKDGRLKHFAIANPAVAPYGERAQEALEHAGLWQTIQPKLVTGENVAQAAQFALSGSTQGGLVALSLVMSPDVQARSNYAVVPEQWHKPLLQRMVLLKPENTAASRFYTYLQGDAARKVLQRYGYGVGQ